MSWCVKADGGRSRVELIAVLDDESVPDHLQQRLARHSVGRGALPPFWYAPRCCPGSCSPIHSLNARKSLLSIPIDSKDLTFSVLIVPASAVLWESRVLISFGFLVALMVWYGISRRRAAGLAAGLYMIALIAAGGKLDCGSAALTVKYRDVVYRPISTSSSGLYISPVGLQRAIGPERWPC